jgi:hypothetical protein
LQTPGYSVVGAIRSPVKPGDHDEIKADAVASASNTNGDQVRTMFGVVLRRRL